ncbi:MAG TPA: hypothetical protein VFW44_21100 [Bryobacteraceae bacterium]|nr:hypothetical protein [Bryobacteraceae bacterium]
MRHPARHVGMHATRGSANVDPKTATVNDKESKQVDGGGRC